MAVPAEAEAHGDFAGNGAHSAAGDAEKAHLLDASGVPEAVLFLGELLRAAARAEDHANLPLLVEVHPGMVEAGVCEGLGGSGDGEGHHTRDVLALPGIDPGEFVEIRDLAGNLDRQTAGIKPRNALHAGLAGKDCPGKGRLANAIGADDAESGDDDAGKHASF